jgi:hypothetical protein
VKLVDKIKTRYKLWKDRRFLKKHGCETWKQYHYRNDPDVFYPATRIKDYYRGYPYVYCIENRDHEVYYWDLGLDGTFTVSKWCEENCKGKFRLDFHRAMNTPGTAYQWEINELGGGDYIFVAFKDPKDYTWFLIKWS